LRVNGVKIYKISPQAKSYYRYDVKGNDALDDQQIAYKLSRNILLAHKVKSKKWFGRQSYIYGNLKIDVRWNTIVSIYNHPSNLVPTWKLNEKDYIELNKRLGIKDCKFKKKTKKVIKN